MTSKKPGTPEQNICILCGLCCDGTLFDKAVLQKGEKGNLPPKIEEGIIISEGQEYFRLPCSYFSGKCTIYYQKKAHVCSGFICRLLNDYRENKLSHSEAIGVVVHAKELRQDILRIAEKVFGKDVKLPFRELQSKVVEMYNDSAVEVNRNLLKLLMIKCYIFEALLVRHFKSEDEFQAMIVETQTEKERQLFN